MSVKPSGQNTWQIKVSVRVPGRNNPVQKQETFFGTKTEAKCREAEIIGQLKAGSLTYSVLNSKGISTFKEAVDLYTAKLQVEGRLSKDHKRKVDRICREFGHLPLEDVPDRFDAWLKHVARASVSAGRKCSPATLNRPVEIVRAVYNYLVALEEMPKNPINKIRFPKHKETPRNRHLTQEERLALRTAIERHRPHILPIIVFMTLVPCRVSELTTARRSQFNPFDHTIYIPKSKAGIPIYKPIPPEMYGYFDNLPVGCDWLFFREQPKGIYHPIALRKAWHECLRLAGITDLRIHDLRHVAATGLIDAGNSAEVVSVVAGWTSTFMLKTYYNQDSQRGARSIVFGGEAMPARELKFGGFR